MSTLDRLNKDQLKDQKKVLHNHLKSKCSYIHKHSYFTLTSGSHSNGLYNFNNSTSH